MKTIVLINSFFFLGFMLNAQPPEYHDLMILYSEGNYKKLVKQSEKYTLKDLMKICCYYGIDKNIKASKCRKQDIIATIVFFEGQPENAVIVYKRHNMWAYMKELMTDPKMRAYLLW